MRVIDVQALDVRIADRQNEILCWPRPVLTQSMSTNADCTPRTETHLVVEGLVNSDC